MNIQIIDINKLIPATYNPRKDLKPTDEEYQKIKRSIEEFGFVSPLVVNKDMTVIGGHQRLKVLMEIGYKEVECIVVDLNKTKEKALNVALNKISGEWDTEKLETLLQELLQEDFDVSITGFNSEEIDNLLNDYAEAGEDEFDVEEALNEIEEPKTKVGDVWILGKHRLMCGDCTKSDDVDKLVNGAIMDLCVTDPPYNVNYGSINETGYGKVRENGNRILNDNMDDESFYKFLNNFYNQMLKVLKPGGAYYIFHADSEGYNFRKALMDAGGQVKQTLIWVKNNFVLGRQDYQWKHEPCLYGWKEGASHYFIEDRTQTTVTEDIKPNYSKMKKEELIQVIEEMENRLKTTIMNEDKPTVNDLHPTMKPIRLLARQIKNSSRINENVIDLFGGSRFYLNSCRRNKQNLLYDGIRSKVLRCHRKTMGNINK